MLFPHKIASKYFMSMLARLFFYRGSASRTALSSEKTCLILRLDGIGDYVLFRPFIKELKNSKKYKGYRLTLLCDSSLQGFADKLDGEYIDEFIWLKRNKFFKNPFYALGFLKKLSVLSFDSLISPVHTRNFFFTDTFVHLIKAKEKIGSIGDSIDISTGQKLLANIWYTKLLPTSNKVIFELYRNKAFFEELTGEKSTTTSGEIELAKGLEHCRLLIPQKAYAVLFLGGSHELRRWSWESFLAIAKHLINVHHLKIILCGSKNEARAAEVVIQGLGQLRAECTSLAGKTSLYELLWVLRGAQLLVSNETGAVHMAAAVNSELKMLVLSNGNNLGRFAPYPSSYKNYRILLPEEIFSGLKRDANKYLNRPSYLDINGISAEVAKAELDKLLADG
jgi:ADP-heptose:LPS heptosyltransferase